MEEQHPYNAAAMLRSQEKFPVGFRMSIVFETYEPELEEVSYKVSCAASHACSTACVLDRMRARPHACSSIHLSGPLCLHR